MKSICAIGLILCLSTAPAKELKRLPDHSLWDNKGDKQQLSELVQGKISIVNFWATWCAPCMQEMLQIKKLYQTYEDKNVQVISISIDDPKTKNKVNFFVRSRNLPFIILHDANKEYFNTCHFNTVPSTLIVDQESNIVYSHSGYRPGDEKMIEQHIQALLLQE